MGEPEAYTLDTSAIIAYFADEPGADWVEHALTLAGEGKVVTYASFMTHMEVLYRVWNRAGEKAGKAAYLRLKALAIRRLDVSETLLVAAARLKAIHDLSVADAWIAATALITESTLVHRDPEFRPLADELPMLELPPKPSRTKAPRR